MAARSAEVSGKTAVQQDAAVSHGYRHQDSGREFRPDHDAGRAMQEGVLP